LKIETTILKMKYYNQFVMAIMN